MYQCKLEVTRLNLRLSELEDRNLDLERVLQNMTDTIVDLENIINDLSSDNEEHKFKLNRFKSTFETSRNDLDILRHELNQNKEAISDKHEINLALKKEIESLNYTI